MWRDLLKIDMYVQRSSEDITVCEEICWRCTMTYWCVKRSVEDIQCVKRLLNMKIYWHVKKSVAKYFVIFTYMGFLSVLLSCLRLNEF
jgi:hypothetical protein